VQFVLALAPGVGKAQISCYLKPEVQLQVVEDATLRRTGRGRRGYCLKRNGNRRSRADGHAHDCDLPACARHCRDRSPGWCVRRCCDGQLDRREARRSGTRSERFHAGRVASEVIRLLDSPQLRSEMRGGLASVREKLGPPAPSDGQRTSSPACWRILVQRGNDLA